MIARNMRIIWTTQCDSWLKNISICYLKWIKQPVERHDHSDPFTNLKISSSETHRTCSQAYVYQVNISYIWGHVFHKAPSPDIKKQELVCKCMTYISSVATYYAAFSHLWYNLVTTTLLKRFGWLNSVIKCRKCDFTLSFWLELIIFKLYGIALQIKI